MNRPEIVYRYLSLQKSDRLEQLFQDSKLYFARPSEFNDPFEFKPKKMLGDSPDLAPELVAKYIDPSIDLAYDLICAELDKFGVCCFSAPRDDPIMWAHYGDRHYGICVGFRTDGDFFSHLGQVDYHADRLDLNLKNWEVQDLIKRVMLRKHEAWSYEQEWRLVKRGGSELVSFPPESLQSVTFGARCEAKGKEAVAAMIKSRSIELYGASIDKFVYRINIAGRGA